MSLHLSDLKSRLTRFLARKQMPRRFEGKDATQADEIAALVAVLARCAPPGADALAAWWPHFEGRLGEVCGSMWPTEKEIRDAGRQASQEAPRLSVVMDGPDMRPVAITARKMQRGDPVGEEWLWGRNAVELATSGLIDAGTVQRYRSAAFLARQRAYGEDAALAWEAAAKAAHEAAKAVWRQRATDPEPRDTSVPDKGVSFPEGFAA